MRLKVISICSLAIAIGFQVLVGGCKQPLAKQASEKFNEPKLFVGEMVATLDDIALSYDRRSGFLVDSKSSTTVFKKGKYDFLTFKDKLIVYDDKEGDLFIWAPGKFEVPRGWNIKKIDNQIVYVSMPVPLEEKISYKWAAIRDINHQNFAFTQVGNSNKIPPRIFSKLIAEN